MEISVDSRVQEALSGFGLKETEHEFLRHNENIVYLCQTPRGEKAVLRLHRPAEGFSLSLFGDQSSESRVLGEMRLLCDLFDSSLLVPRPIPAKDGALYLRLSDGTVATCLSWIEGKSLDSTDRTEEVLYAIGAAAGELRSYSVRSHCSHYDRIRYDFSLLSRMQAVFSEDAAAFLGAENAAVAAETVCAIARYCSRLGDAPDVFGIVHSDLAPGNILLTPQGRVALIDFGLSGYSWFDMDLGSLHSHFTDRAEREALAKGYADRTGIFPDDTRALPFLALQVLLFLATHYENAPKWDWLAGSMERWKRQHFMPVIALSR